MPHIGIMGGTFDPVHLGHLAAAEGAMHLAGLERVVFLPNRQPPHKAGRLVTPAEHRAAMVRLAIADNPRFEFSALELERQGPSYTIETVRALQALHPDWQLAFLVGMDSLIDIQSWFDYRTLLTLIDLVVVTRPGYGPERGEAVLAELGLDLTRRIRILETPGLDISGTELRRQAADGYPLRYLVPESVSAYIRDHCPYLPGNGGPP